MSGSTLGSSGLTAGSSLTTSGTGVPLQITGLSSGLNTNEIIQAELEEAELPITDMQNEVAGLQEVNNQLSSFQSSLTTVSLDAQALGDPTLFNPTQAVASSDPEVVAATSTDGVGGVIGGTTIAVSQLASAAQRTFTFNSPSASDTVTIDGHAVTIAAGASSQDLANEINDSSNMDVWASATSSGEIVFSARNTGNNGSDFIQVSDTAGSLTEQTALAQNGQDAEYSVNGGATQSSTSDTITSALPGVTLNLYGVTGSGAPVTVTVQPPAADTQSIEAAVNQFVSDYNSAISSIGTTLSTRPSNAASGGTFNPNSGSLFGDNELSNLLSNMRTSMIAGGAGLPSGMASLSDIGISTGGPAADGISTQASISGELTVNSAQLTQAIESDPSGVEAVLQQWSQRFQTIVNNEAAPGGAMENRIEGNNTEVTNLDGQVSAMQALYNEQEQSMEKQWANVEATLSKLQSQSSAVTSVFSSLSSSPSSGSSSSSG
jgi:flagellar hook-associated protein 2